MQKAISILLCVLMLASSTKVTYAKHFCGEYEVLSTFTFGEKDLTCGMTMDADDCDDSKSNTIPCCKNKYEKIDIDDNYSFATFDMQINIPFITSFISVFITKPFVGSKKTQNHYANYESPPINKDIPVLYQVFII